MELAPSAIARIVSAALIPHGRRPPRPHSRGPAIRRRIPASRPARRSRSG